MCGIFGLYADSKSDVNKEQIETLTENLFLLSESRGKDSAGIAYLSEQSELQCYKRDIPARQFLKSKQFQDLQKIALAAAMPKGKIETPLKFIGHCRMVTNGTEEKNENNQPVLKNSLAVVHNGIICNVEELWKNAKNKREADVDTEILNELLPTDGSWESSVAATISAFKTIEGSASIAALNHINHNLTLASNTGSLFYAVKKDNSMMVFASEEYILKKALENSKLITDELSWQIHALGSRGGVVFETKEFAIHPFTLEYKTPDSSHKLPVNIVRSATAIDKHLVYRLDKIKSLRRCSKCVLPETFPFIEFDQEGVCNYCKSYVPSAKTQNPQKLLDIVVKTKKANSKFDCIVPFSGGRDSSYGLHYLVKDLGLKPITYTYDWGMVTDLARRNVSRMCASLGIENILISADIKTKRANIRKNVLAWLKKPELGMVPLFMAGDKQFLYYVNKIKEQTNVNLDIWMPNRLENTDFKTGFCGIRPPKNKARIDALPLSSKIKMVSYYAKNYLLNPAYINSSLADTAFAYFSYYFEPRTNFTVLFDYLPWDEKKINSTLIDQYNWETSPDSTSTWRIGDGTAPFYNYIYTTVAGFSEVDTFRSNQIREGMITRSEALELVEKENVPRAESLKWYLDILNIDVESTIKRINETPTLY